MNILFDSMGVQVQVQQQTGIRLTTWTTSLTSAGYQLSYTDYTQPIECQLEGNDVLVILTRQWTQTPNGAILTCPAPSSPPLPNAIPRFWNFSYNHYDLGGIVQWVNDGGGLLLFTNHTEPPGSAPYFPIYDIQLAAALGITVVYATFNLSAFTLAPEPSAPAAIINGVTSIQALDSGGIVPGQGTVLIPLPKTSADSGPYNYSPSKHAFGVLYEVGEGKVIVLGHSGIVANDSTCWPSPGQIGSVNNEQFLNNCIAYLGS
jgi:hypothetical protein